jgi:two-component system, OmpR family, alkaline phosphatase synthesis response regulator PhoP
MNDKPSILIVDDEVEIRNLLTYNLDREGFQVAGAESGEEALRLLARQVPDLVLLDLMLPGIDGLTLCRRLRNAAATANVPIIMLTAKGGESDVVAGLNAGANDYISKPFSPRVLVARVRAALRRRAEGAAAQSGEEESQVIQAGNLWIHVGRHEVRVSDQPIELSAMEFRLLHFLARRPGWVFTRQQILDSLHGDKHEITGRAVDVQIVGLRKRLGAAAECIETVRGVGYRFVD